MVEKPEVAVQNLLVVFFFLKNNTRSTIDVHDGFYIVKDNDKCKG